MSWELTSFLILGAVLVAGFVWYERSRPPAQVVALVAALAALAIAGRIAFAAFPNVKPTTDIVIFAGYALGGAPGFAVGALAALVSNLWFGQGPWTPWQMAGWGLCGILGAALALGGRNVGRLSLAATCGFAGIAYGALLNFSLMATYGGDLSLERFGVLEARAIPFDLAHAAGNVAFALIAGPALVRMLSRFRERFEWGRGGGPEAPAAETGGQRPALRGAGIAALLLVSLVLGALAPTRAEASEVSRAADWLVSVQNPDGGFGSAPEDDSGAEMTAWAMLGLEAAGRNPLDVARIGRTPVDFLRGAVGELKSPGDLARTILALEGAGVDPREFGGANLVSRLLAKRRDNGSYEGWPGSTAFAVIALRAADASGGLEKSLSWLQRSPERRRRLGRRARLAQHRRRHRRRDAGALARLQGDPARHLLPAPGPAPRRRLPARRQRRRQQPVDRLGDPGHPRRRRRPRLLPPRRQERPRIPRRPAGGATATTATPSQATRPRSGSPARSSSPPPASYYPVPPPPREPKPSPPAPSPAA